MKRWIILICGIIGILALCAIIWFVFPLIAIAGFEPFGNAWLRLALIVLVLAIYFALLTYSIIKHRRAAQQLAENITVQEPEDDNSDAGVLAEKMQDALLTLRGSQKTRGDYLYELPWYLIVGPPGAGKTTALLNCGLKFPLSAQAAAGPIAGSGGTRYCDWWFTEEAVFIDTAGRYTTQDSDADQDRKSWLSFLDLLKRHRSRQPINGVLVAISIGDLLTLKQAELATHAVAIRKRLAELNNRLQVDFPVYVVFTKADLISGFMEYFGNLDEQRRKLVWGATFQTSNKKENRVTEVGPEIDLLVSRLAQELPDRLQEEPDPISRVRLVGLPTQVAALKPSITQFLNQIFEPTRYQTSATLRGFYFTSGTQEGTPIDRVLGSLGRKLGIAASVSQAYAGRGKSFFLENLLTKVVFGEAGWVSTNARAVRRSLLLRTAGYSLTTLIAVGALAAWFTSYFSNSALIAATDASAKKYNFEQREIVTQDPIRDADFLKILDPLDKLRNMPAGFETADISPPLKETFGLSQKNRLTNSTSAAYATGLDRLLRPRLIVHLEKRLTELKDQPEQLYEPLKVYLMLQGDPNIPVDVNLISGWMQGDWSRLFPGEPNKIARDNLRRHLETMLDVNAGNVPVIQLNGDLIKQTQTTLARLSPAERAFALIKSTAHGDVVKDWTVAGKAGPEAAAVFTTSDGSPLEAVGVQALYTYDGFYALFLGRMAGVIDLLQKERWVLGEQSGQALDKQFSTIGPDLFKIYNQEFIKAWTNSLNQLKLKSFSADAPDYATLRAATGAASPIKLLMESIAAETRLTEAKADAAGGEVDPALKDAAVKVGQRALDRATTGGGSLLQDMKQIGLDAARKSQGRGGEVETAFVPGAVVQERFRRYHELTAAAGGKSQVDLLIEQLKGMHQSLVDEQNFEQAAEARQNLQKFISALATSSSRLEPPFSAMFKSAIGEFENKIVGARVADLQGELKGSVTRKCLDVVSGKYPFAADSKRDVPMTEFSRLFGPNGVFDSFYKTKLAGLVDTSGTQWTWKQNSKLSQELSQKSLLQFQKAARIKDAFFTGQGNSPNVKFALILRSMSQKAPSTTFEVNGAKLESPNGVESRGDFEWPGSSPDGTASVSMPAAEGAVSELKFTGPWALHRLIGQAALRQSGNKAVASFVVKGREVTYQMTFDTLDNPFTIISQVKFSCPSDL